MTDSARTLFKGGTIVTMDAKIPHLVVGDVLVEGDRVAAVEANIGADDAEVIDAAGTIVLPGLIDAHHHAWLGVMRRLMPDVDDLFAYIDVVAEKLGAHYRPLDMYVSTKLTAIASLDAGITTIVDASHNSRSPEHTDAALESLDSAGIRALHMVGAAMDKKASAEHLPRDLERLSLNWNTSNSLVRVGLFGQLNLDWWKVARSLNISILTEFIGDLAKLGPQFARPALGIDLDTAFGSDMFGEMRALFGQQRTAMRYRRFRGEVNAAAQISVDEVLRAATVNGARVAGLEMTTGTLTPGKQADIIMLRTNGVAVFPVTNAIGTIVQAVERSDVDTVMVAGRLRKRSGKLVGVDIEKLAAEAIASLDYLREASGYRTNLFGTSTPELGVTA
jgi:cytosine/adenosine deaminase-related metal-dependent hydrolase